ncbi:MAG: hypothetical protein ACRC8S_02220 [Fimbriiglobus sp.]
MSELASSHDFPRRTLRSELPGFLIGIILTVLFLVVGMRLDKADLNAPFTYDYDALLILPFVKQIVDGSTHWHTERLGAPGAQDLHDFPVIDHLHFAILWLMSWVFRSPVVVFNLFYLLTYPLTTLTTIYVCRRYKMTMVASIVMGVLYAFQPYHYLRGQTHYFLAAYYIIPLTMMVIIDICRGELPFFDPKVEGWFRIRIRNRATISALLIGLATSSAGAYYAFYACGLLLMAGGYGWVRTYSVRPAISAGLVTFVVGFGGVLNHIPTFIYQYQYGQNSRPHTRLAEEAELYGMKIAQLILPVAGHNPVAISPTVYWDLAGIRSAYLSPGFKGAAVNEADWNPIGFLASCGYIALLAVCFLPVRRSETLGPLSALTLFATLYATTGGFGAVFNLLVSPQVRCPNRISIYIAFAALFVVCRAVDRFFFSRSGIVKSLRIPVFGVILLFGIWDQTNDQWFPDLRIPRPGYMSVVDQREATRKQFYDDKEFFEKVQNLQPEGMIFNYPYMEFPESRYYSEPGAALATLSYEYVLGYVHTKNLRFSYGAMKGREWDNWARSVSTKEPIPRFLERITLMGFEGLVLDNKGINPKRWRELSRELDQYLGAGAMREEHLTRKLRYYDLRGYRENLISNYGQAGFDARVEAERKAFYVLWLKGFESFEPVGYEDRNRSAGPKATAIFVNPSDAPITVPVRMKLRTSFRETANLRITSTLQDTQGQTWSDEMTLPDRDRFVEYERVLIVPPGRHKVEFRCTPSIPVQQQDSRNYIYMIQDFRTK